MPYLESGSVSGTLVYSTNECVVQIGWKCAPGGESTKAVANKTDSWATAYWPTDVCALAPGRFVISGKSKGEKAETILEEWTFANGGVPVVETALSEQTGKQLRWTLPPRVAVKELYRDAVPGRDMVVDVFPNHGKQGEVFVQFADSRDIWSLRLSDGGLTRILAAVPGRTPPVTVEPKLALPYVTRWSALSNEHGYVYFFRLSNAQWDASAETLVLEDTDRDGCIETTYSLDNARWLQRGWGSPAGFVSLYLN